LLAEIEQTQEGALRSMDTASSTLGPFDESAVGQHPCPRPIPADQLESPRKAPPSCRRAIESPLLERQDAWLDERAMRLRQRELLGLEGSLFGTALRADTKCRFLVYRADLGSTIRQSRIDHAARHIGSITLESCMAVNLPRDLRAGMGQALRRAGRPSLASVI
jgi:hypothetical protein